MEAKIRVAELADAEAIVALIREFGGYLNELDLVTITPEALSRAAFTDDSFIEILVAEVDGDVAAYAVFYPHFTSFRGQCGYYLEDIYIGREYRKKGLGRKLLGEIARRGAARGLVRIDFQVLESNSSAIRFYEALGSICDEDERRFKFTDQAFIDLQKL